MPCPIYIAVLCLKNIFAKCVIMWILLGCIIGVNIRIEIGMANTSLMETGDTVVHQLHVFIYPCDIMGRKALVSLQKLDVEILMKIFVLRAQEAISVAFCLSVCMHVCMSLCATQSKCVVLCRRVSNIKIARNIACLVDLVLGSLESCKYIARKYCKGWNTRFCIFRDRDGKY